MSYQWLVEYQDLENQLAFLKWNLNRSKLELNRWVQGDLENVKLKKNSRSSNLEETIKKIEQEIELLEERKVEMIELVNSFKGVDNQIVKLKYIDDLKIEEIADLIGYSISYVRKRYTEINKTLTLLIDFDNSRQKRLRRKSEAEFYEAKLQKE